MSESIFTLGVDIGSSASKAIVLQNGKTLVTSSVVAVGAGTSGPERVIATVLEQAGMSLSQIECVCATGYGRKSLSIAEFEVSELSCHVKGAACFFPDVRTVIDIGGQDAKVMRVEAGQLRNFVMNDKCAAGTGRFLEVMARVLETEVSELANIDLSATAPVNISSTCTVFAESEVVSSLARQIPVADIVAGIHRSVASRAVGLVKRIGFEEEVVMTGGVALNAGVVRSLEQALAVKVNTSPCAQLLGALGAGIYAYERSSGNMRQN